MKRFIAAAILVLGCVGATPAHAYAHGCMNGAGYWGPVPPEIPDADYMGPILPGRCAFRYFSGDTYSGAGDFTIDYFTPVGTAARITHHATDAPVMNQAFAAKPLSIVTVNSGQTGFVVAGSVQ